MEQESNDASGKQSSENPSKSKREGERSELDTETSTSSFDKRKPEVKEEKYITYSAEDASVLSAALSPNKRKCTEIHASPQKIEQGEKLFKDKPTDGDSEADVAIKGSPKRPRRVTGSPFTPLQLQQLSNFSSSFRTSSSTTSVASTIMQRSSERSSTKPGTSAAGDASQRSPKHSPKKSGALVVGAVIQGSPKHSPPKINTPAAGAVIKVSPKHSPTKTGSPATGAVIQVSPKHSPTKTGSPATGAVIQGSPKHSPMKTAFPAAGSVMKGSAKISGSSAADGTSRTSPKLLPSAGSEIQGPPKHSMKPMALADGSVIHVSPNHSSTKTGIAGALFQGSPKRSLAINPTSEASCVIQGPPNPSQSKPGTSAADTVIRESPKRSPSKRTYKERHHSCTADEIVEKRLKEECVYQSDSALDLRKDFQKELPSSTQSPEIDSLPTTLEKIGSVLEEQPGKSSKTSFLRDPRNAPSEVLSSDGEEEVSSTSDDSATKLTDEVASTAYGTQTQNEAGENKKEKSSRASPRHSGARSKEILGQNRSEECIEVSYPKHSPSKRFYGEANIRRISPGRSSPSGSGSGGCFKVPRPPPPLQERDNHSRTSNALATMHSLIESCYALVTAEQLREQTKKEQEEKARRQQEQAENFAKAKVLAKETTKKLREKEARLKESVNRPDTAPDEAVAGPSTFTGGITGYEPENVDVPAYTVATPERKEECESIEPVAERRNLPASQQIICDDNANPVEGQLQIASQDDASNMSAFCSPSGTDAPNPQDILTDEYLSLQELVPQIDEICLDDSLENVAIVDSELEDNIDLLKEVKK